MTKITIPVIDIISAALKEEKKNIDHYIVRSSHTAIVIDIYLKDENKDKKSNIYINRIPRNKDR